MDRSRSGAAGLNSSGQSTTSKRGRNETPSAPVTQSVLVNRDNNNAQPPSRKPGVPQFAVGRGRDAKPVGAAAVLGSKAAPRTGATAAAAPAAPDPRVRWAAALKVLMLRLQHEEAVERQLQIEKDAVEAEISGGYYELGQIEHDAVEAIARADREHASAIERVAAQRRQLIEEEQRMFDEQARLEKEHELANVECAAVNERCILEDDAFESLSDELEAAEKAAAATRLRAEELRTAEELIKSSTYGLSEDAAFQVRRREALEQQRVQLRAALAQTEIERREKFSLIEELKGTIRVYCRVKGGGAPSSSGSAGGGNSPSSSSSSSVGSSADAGTAGARYSFRSNEEGIENGISVTQTRNNATSTGTKETTQAFVFDRVYRQTQSQEQIFDDVGPLVDTAVDGYRVCVFAYGQTGSGKTYTMEGDIGNSAAKGIIPRSIEKVFSRAATLAEEGWSYSVSCYFVEIYNDMIRDLLEKSDAYHRNFFTNRELQRHEIKQDQAREEVTITGVSQHAVTSPAQVYSLLALAVRNRMVAKTALNDRSSRSHCVFTVRIDGTNETLRQRSSGILCLVDLAGSERINDSGVVGQQKCEAININKSLTYLGDCICMLGANRVPSWRNCKLTHLLQYYLGVKGAKLLMFVTVSDKEEHSNETLNSLRFAEKVNQTSVGIAKKRTLPSQS